MDDGLYLCIGGAEGVWHFFSPYDASFFEHAGDEFVYDQEYYVEFAADRTRCTPTGRNRADLLRESGQKSFTRFALSFDSRIPCSQWRLEVSVLFGSLNLGDRWRDVQATLAKWWDLPSQPPLGVVFTLRPGDWYLQPEFEGDSLVALALGTWGEEEPLAAVIAPGYLPSWERSE